MLYGIETGKDIIVFERFVVTVGDGKVKIDIKEPYYRVKKGGKVLTEVTFLN